MDQQDSNRSKAKNWLHRFLKIKNRINERSDNDTSAEKPHLRNSNSLRKRLRKVQTRVKSCMFSQDEAAAKRPFSDLPTTSRRTPPPVPDRPIRIQQDSDRTPQLPPRENPSRRNHRIPTEEIISLSNCYWYWGPMATAEAEEKLKFKPDGTFLVRDSSSASYLFSISFRSVGKTLHARIEYSRGKYNLCGTFAQGFPTVTELIQDAIRTSENGIYCYSRRGEYAAEFPVRLTKPMSRYTEVRDLKHLCKFIIRQCTNINDIPKLPLPTVLHTYLLEKPYF